MAYEKDYRKRILNFYYENGKTKTLFQFNISSSTLYGWIKLKKETGDLSSRTRKRKFKVLDPEEFDEYYYRECGWSKRGISVEGKKRGFRYSRINLVAGKIGDVLIGSMIYKETMKSEFFEEWFREILLRDIEKLEKRVLIVMDNARFHRKRILEKIIKGIGHCLLFLPSYLPDSNPIEKLWANIKKKLKGIAHNFNTLEGSVTSVLFNKLVQF